MPLGLTVVFFQIAQSPSTAGEARQLFLGGRSHPGSPCGLRLHPMGKQAPPKRFDPRETAVTATLPSRHPRSAV